MIFGLLCCLPVEISGYEGTNLRNTEQRESKGKHRGDEMPIPIMQMSVSLVNCLITVLFNCYF